MTLLFPFPAFELVPFIQHLICFVIERSMALGDLLLDCRARAFMMGACTAQEIGKALSVVAESLKRTLPPMFGAALDDKMPVRKILQPLSERLSTVESLRNLSGVSWRQLKEDQRADREDRRAHLVRILAKELVCSNHGNAELAGFGKHRLNACVLGKKVLHLVHVDGEQCSLRAREERILAHRK